MPPRKQPKTLQEISLKKVGSSMIKSFVDIERKHRRWSSHASQNNLQMVTTYLSQIQHLCDDFWEILLNFVCGSLPDEEHFKTNFNYYHNYHRPRDRYQILDVLLCNKLRKLNVKKLDADCLHNSVFWKSQLSKLTNVVELDIRNVRLTHESFQAIGDNCLSVRKIAVTSDPTYASMESLKHLLKCTELRDVTISFHNWNENRKSEYIRMFVTSLPKLEYYNDWLEEGRETKVVLSIATPVPSMRKVRVKKIKSAELVTLLRLCPNLTDIELGVLHFVGSNEEENQVIKILTESSLQLKSLALYDVSFSLEMIQSITSKFRNLTSLHISDWDGERMSVKHICTIGVNCPNVEKLWIEEPYRSDQVDSTNLEEQNSVSTLPMFVGLKVLCLRSSIMVKQRILPLILRHANSLADISLSEVFRSASNSVDILSEILDANTLHQLERLVLSLYSGLLRVTSIERLLTGCPKLTKLCLECPMEDAAYHYLRELKCSIKSENFDFSLVMRMYR